MEVASGQVPIITRGWGRLETRLGIENETVTGTGREFGTETGTGTGTGTGIEIGTETL